MKKISTILIKVLLVFCVLTSCKKDEEDTKPKGPVYTGSKKITFVNALESSVPVDLVVGNQLLLNEIKYGWVGNVDYNFSDSTLLKVVKHNSSDTILKKYVKFYELKEASLFLFIHNNDGAVDLTVYEQTDIPSTSTQGKALVSFINLIDGTSSVLINRAGSVSLSNFPTINYKQRLSYVEVDFGMYEETLLNSNKTNGDKAIFVLPKYYFGGGGTYTVFLSGTPTNSTLNILEQKKSDQRFSWIKFINNDPKTDVSMDFLLGGEKMVANVYGRSSSNFLPVPIKNTDSVSFEFAPSTSASKFGTKKEKLVTDNFYTYVVGDYTKLQSASAWSDFIIKDTKNMENLTAKINFINNVKKAGEFTIDVVSSAGNKVLLNDLPKWSTQIFTNSSGSFTINIQQADNLKSYFSKEVTVEAGKSYSMILEGSYEESTSTNTLSLQIYQY